MKISMIILFVIYMSLSFVSSQEKTMADTALILVDIQNDYFPGGKMVLEGSLEASEKAKQALALFREKGWPVIHIQHISMYPGAFFFLPETIGVEIHKNVTPLPEECVIIKHYPNSFRETSLLECLQKKNIKQVVIIGMMTHMCVEATTRAAFDYGFQCTVLHDACATRQLVFLQEPVPAKYVHASFLAALGLGYARVISTEEWLQAVESPKK